MSPAEIDHPSEDSMTPVQIDPERAADIVEEFRELAKSMDQWDAAKAIGEDYGMSAEQILRLVEDAN